MYLGLKLYTVTFFLSGQTYKISKGSNYCSHCICCINCNATERAQSFSLIYHGYFGDKRQNGQEIEACAKQKVVLHKKKTRYEQTGRGEYASVILNVFSFLKELVSP